MTCTNPELAGHTNPRGKTQASFDCVRMTYILVQVNGIENRVKAIHITPPTFFADSISRQKCLSMK